MSRKNRSKRKLPARRERHHASVASQESQPTKRSAFLYGCALISVGAVLTLICITLLEASSDESSQRYRAANATVDQSQNSSQQRTTWQLLALPEHELEQVDVVELNLAVVREIPGLEDLDTQKYQKIVDTWAEQIRQSLPAGEKVFQKSPEQWQNDIRFFRLGQVAGFLNEGVGIAYIEKQKEAKEVRYNDPAELFLHGLIDNKRGTCGNMPTLHVAIGRRLGWPVSLASVGSHSVCRFDDGQVTYNVETTDTEHGGMFAAATDKECLKKFGLPSLAISSGSDLRNLTSREMLGYFIGLRARHYADLDRIELADRDYALARSLLPNHRWLLKESTRAAILKSSYQFETDESGHPFQLTYMLNLMYAKRFNKQLVWFDHAGESKKIERLSADSHKKIEDSFSQPQYSSRSVPNPNNNETPVWGHSVPGLSPTFQPGHQPWQQ